MYNTKVECNSCSWNRIYDSNRDTWGIDNYIYCPICGKRLNRVGYSPNI